MRNVLPHPIRRDSSDRVSSRLKSVPSCAPDLLNDCEGFWVDSPEGRVGIVEKLRFGVRADQPEALIVRASAFDTDLILVPVSEVESIFPKEQRIVLRKLRRLSLARRFRQAPARISQAQ
ncbi:MAG: hypothetical protein M3R26_06330 [Actinomycetota bacterium]|nr:hypothetical protein [Actinomycetota bacterium]MDQ2981919.1 hypothetical protein [Actinomycetota bacterium]